MDDLACARCHTATAFDATQWHCTCGGPLVWTADSPRQLRTGDGLWRDAASLPTVDPAHRVTLGEGDTPLLRRGHVAYKLEFASPTGSFKDRGACVVASVLRQAGVTRAVADSSGNAGAAMAAYLAAARIEALIFAPASVSPGKLRQARAYGARVELVDGDRGATTAAAQAWAREHGATYASHLWSPFFVAGMRTVARELVDQLGDVPDAIVMPVGSGSLLLGASEGFEMLRRERRVTRTPRLFGVQASACSPLANAFALQREDLGDQEPGPRQTAAEGVRIARPPRAREILAAVRCSAGALLAVEEDELKMAWRALAHDGLFVEPTAALAEAGRLRLQLTGVLTPGARSVVVLTGSGLKSTAGMHDA